MTRNLALFGTGGMFGYSKARSLKSGRMGSLSELLEIMTYRFGCWEHIVGAAGYT